MERLTKRARRVSGLPGVCCTHFESGDCMAVAGHCSDGCPWEEAAWERLAAYEDTELEPEDIERIHSEYGRGLTLRTSCSERLEIIYGIPTDTLREIVRQHQGKTSKPECPYCGNEMTLVTLSPQFPRDLTHQYTCLRCGAEAPKGAGEQDAYRKATHGLVLKSQN